MKNDSDEKAEIVSLSAYRDEKALRAGFRLWQLCLKEEGDGSTRIMDLGPQVLLRLAEPGSDVLFYSLIIGFTGHSEQVRFETLAQAKQMHVLDVHLFLSDQIRFEMMRRLGWVVRFVAAGQTLFELVREFERCRAQSLQNPPLLAQDHSEYEYYSSLIEQDKQVFIRRLFRDALEAFERECSD
jgi:hypothetical protein